MTIRGKFKLSVLLFILFNVVDGQTSAEEDIRSFRCHNIEDSLTDVKVSTYVVNNGYPDCNSELDETFYDDDASVKRHGMVSGEVGSRQVTAIAMACMSEGNSLDTLFPVKKLACPGNYSGSYFDCTKLCDGILDCENGLDEDVCFSSERSVCMNSDELGTSGDFTSGKEIYPRQCEQYCSSNFIPFNWWAIIPGKGEEDDFCECYDSPVTSIPIAMPWEDCSEPCFYGNGLIPCGNTQFGKKRAVFGIIRPQETRPTYSDCEVQTPSCVAPFATVEINVTCSFEDDMEMSAVVNENRCLVSNRDMDENKVYYVMPNPQKDESGNIIAGAEEGSIAVELATSYGIMKVPKSFSLCPREVVSLEITGLQYQPKGHNTDMMLTLYGGESMKLTLWTETASGKSEVQTIAESLNLVHSMGQCFCEAGNPLAGQLGDIMQQQVKGEKMVFPHAVQKAGYIYGASACIHTTDNFDTKFAGDVDLKIQKVRPECLTEGYEFCEATGYCHSPNSLCDANSADKENPSFVKVMNGERNNQMYGLERFLDSCGCDTVFSDTDKRFMTKVEPGDYLLVELFSLYQKISYYIEGDISANEEIIVLDTSFRFARRMQGKMSLQLHIYEEHTIDLSEAAVISTEGEAAVFAQIEYSYGCCGPLLSEKPVTVQTVPGFVSIETSSLRGSVLTAAGDEIEIGPFNSGPISVQALGSSLNYSFSTTSSEITVTAEEGQNFFEVDCGCSAEEQSCQHVVDIHIKNNLEEKYDVNKPVTVHCDHCNLPSLELILKMEPAAGGESYPVPHLVGRDENVLIFFEKGQSCNRIQRCNGAEAVWTVNGVMDPRFVTSELPYSQLNLLPNNEMEIQVCQKYCKDDNQDVGVEACGSVRFVVSPSKCSLTKPSFTSIVLNEAKEVTIGSSDPDGQGACDECSMSVTYQSHAMTQASVAEVMKNVTGKTVMVDSPSQYEYSRGEYIDVDFCCSDAVPNRPDSCGHHQLEVIAPGEPEIEMIDSAEVERCDLDCDEDARFEVDLNCDNCGPPEEYDRSGINVRWTIRHEDSTDCNENAPVDYEAMSNLYRYKLSDDNWTFKYSNVCSIFRQPETTDGICLCVQVQFPRGLGGQKRTICRKYMRNFGPIFNETLLQPSKITQVPIPANCIPIANTTNFTFDPMLAYGPYKPIKYNVEYDGVPLSKEDTAAPKFTVFLKPGVSEIKIRANDSCNVQTYRVIQVSCEQDISEDQVEGVVDGMGEIDSPETQQKTLSQLNAASDKCNAGCADKVSMVLEGVSVEDDNAAAQVASFAAAAKVDTMSSESQGRMVKMVEKSYKALGKKKGNTKGKSRALRQGANLPGKVMLSGFKKTSSGEATTTTTTTTTTSTSTVSADGTVISIQEQPDVCGGQSGQSADVATMIRSSLGDLASAIVCGLAEGEKSPAINVTEDNPVFSMSCTRSKNQLFPDTGTHIPELPSDCDGDSCALCNIKFLGCADAMPADNAPSSEKVDIKLLKITWSETDEDECNLSVLKIRDLPIESAIEFSNENLAKQPVVLTSANLTQQKDFLSVDVNVSDENSALIVDFCLDTLSMQATQIVVRMRYNFSSHDWTTIGDDQMDFANLAVNTSAVEDDFFFIFDPANFTGLIEEVYLDGVGLISNETRDECLTSNIVANNCFRAFLSGFTLANRVGPWSVAIMAGFQEEPDDSIVQEIDTIVYQTSCLYYNEVLQTYTTEGTSPSPSTSCAQIKCKTTHLSSFGGSFFVPPNSLNVMDSIMMLSSLHENPTVFATLVSVLILYILVVVWCRRKDRRDEKKLGITFLADNDPRDNYQYEITVYTGIGGDAGTSSNVTIILCGEKTNSKPHVLLDEDKELFCSGSVDTFILTTPESLGELSSLQIWHNNKGNQPAWYLKHLVAKDLNDNNKQYIFLNNRWLAVDKDDGQVDREIPVASEDELKDFTTLFKNKIERDLWDGNIWFSVFGRPVRSSFTRVQRASCCLCLLYCTMLANIMFFGAAEADTNTISVMGIELSWTQVMIGLQCNVVIFPVNFLVVYLFKNAKPRVPKELRDTEAMKSGKSLTAARGHHRSAKSQRSFTNLNSASRTSIQSAGRMTVSHTSMFKSKKSKPKGLFGKLKAMMPGQKKTAKDQLEASTCSIESVINEPPPSEMEEGKKPKGLPWWTVYIAWVLMVMVSFVAAFFTLLYGMAYGKSQSNLWLKTFLMGFFESLFFIQPLKCICLGLFFALLIKKPEQPDPKEQQRMEIIENTSERGKAIVELDYSDYKRQYKKLQQAYSKPMATDLEAAKKYREKMKKMWDALFEIGRYFIFLFLLSTICNAQTDPQGYLMTENLRNMFTTGTKWPGITKYPDYWAWMYKSLIPNLYSQQWYNGNVTDDIQGFTSDHQSYLVGAARIRQVRMDPLAHCYAPKIIQETVNDCYPDYSLGDGDVAGYYEGWIVPPENETINTDEYYLNEKDHPVGSNPWVYVPQLQADGIPIMGDLNMYGPGGYILTLSTDPEKAKEDVERLQEMSWVDTLTRAVIIEFTVFNPNVNLFSVVSLVVEFSAQGDGYPYEQMKTLRLYPYMSSAGYLVLVCQLAYLVFLIYYMWVEAKEVKQLKWGYLKQFWNWVEIVIIVLSWTSFGLIISYVIGVEVTMNQIKEFSNTRFISFGGPATVNETYRVVSAITCYFGYIKLMYMMRFNKKMSSFACVLKVAANDITNFLIMFTVVFIAFAQFAYLVLGSVVSGYKSFVTCSTTLMAMLLGQWDFYEVEEADRMLGPGFLFTYIISANLILLNVFLSIICEACDQVNGEVAQQENDFEVVDFMVGQVKMLIGTSRLTQNAAKKMQDDLEQEKEDEMEGELGEDGVPKKPIDIDSVLCDFEGQMNYISGHYCGSSSEDEEDEEFGKMLSDYGNSRSQLLNASGNSNDEHSFSARSFNIAVQG